MPMGPYKDFDDCVKTQRRRGLSEEEASAYCGAIKHRVEGSVPKQEAEWTTASANDLPDSSFAYIEPGGTKDSDGKTTPRGLRHLPYKNKSGDIDLPHLRNALARLPQTNISPAAKATAKGHLCAAAKKVGLDSEVCKTGDKA